MPIKAANNFVLLIRDKSASEAAGLIIPTSGRQKMNTGEIFSVGELAKDRHIKSGKGKKALFHQTVGFTIEHEGVEYLVLQEHEIIAVI